MFKKKIFSNKSGFTLLEVMIAVSIMVVAFGAILTSQSGSIHLTIKTKELNIAGWLAQNKMIEAEHEFEGKPFSELPTEPQGEKFAAPFERFAWKREIKEIEFPEVIQQMGQSEAVPEATKAVLKNITDYLSAAIRELSVTITWQRGETEQRVQITTYLVDLNTPLNIGF